LFWVEPEQVHPLGKAARTGVETLLAVEEVPEGRRRWDRGRVDASEGFAAAVFHALRYMWWGDVGSRWGRILYGS
jgi:hypothetical protein